MARVTYQASARDKPFDPNLIPDTSDRILKQSRDYIENLKDARDFQAAQDAQFIQEYTAGIERGVKSKRKVDLEQEKQARALAQYKIGLMRDQARRAQSMGGSITGSKAESWVKFIAQASVTAAQTFGQIKKAQDEVDSVVAQEIVARYPISEMSIGSNMEVDSARIQGQYTESLATIAEQKGNMEMANDLRNLNSGQRSHLQRLMGVKVGRDFGPSFQRDIYSSESVMDVMIDGESVPINTLRSSEDIAKASAQYRDYHFKRHGIDPSSKLATKGLAASQESLESLLGQLRGEELKTAKNNLYDEAVTAFNIQVQDPNEAQAAGIDLFQRIFHLNGGDKAGARAFVFDQFKKTGVTSNAAFLAFQQAILPGQTKTVGETYPGDVREARQSRLQESSQIQAESDVQQQTEARAEMQRVYKARIADKAEDGDVDMSLENVKAQIEKYTTLGPNWDDARVAWESLIPDLASTKRDEELNDQFQELADRGALSEDFVMRSDGSEDLKRKWLKSINATAQQTVRKEDLDSFKDIARAMLIDRSGETPGATGRSNNAYTKRALKGAVEQYRKDYVVALRDGQTPAQAAAYAEGRFNDIYEDENGKYKVTKATETRDGEEIVVGQYINFGPQTAKELEEPLIHVNRKIEEYGADVYDQVGIIPKPTLERVSQNLLNNKRIMIPPMIVTLADTSGGKLSVLDVLNRQLAANGLEQVPSDMFNVAKETQDSISPEWQQRINYKPNVMRTDAALIGSGQDPIYNQRIPVSVENDVEFQREVFAMSQRLGVSESDLYAIMDFETGGSFDPAQKNLAGSGATGLIQLMPSTAEGLGTTTQELASMTRVQQLSFVEKHLVNVGVKPGSKMSDLYMAVLFPAAVGKGDDFVLFGNGAMSGFEGRAYEQNKGLDKNGNGSITKGEATVKVLGHANVWRQRRNLNPALKAAIPKEEPPIQAPALSGFFKYDKDGNEIPAN